MAHRGLIQNFTAGTAIGARRVIAIGTGDGLVKQATANTDGIIGISDDSSVTADERVDVVMSGSAPADCGGVVQRGDFLTADAAGKVVTGTGRVVGIALQSGVAGDVIDVLIAQGKV